MMLTKGEVAEGEGSTVVAGDDAAVAQSEDGVEGEGWLRMVLL